MEQVQEICRKFFAQMSASENDIGLPLKIVMEVFDHFEKVVERQLNDLQQGRGPPLKNTLGIFGLFRLICKSAEGFYTASTP